MSADFGKDTGSIGQQLVKADLNTKPISVVLANLEIEATCMEILSKMYGMSQL
jgi:hypothetical protein